MSRELKKIDAEIAELTRCLFEEENDVLEFEKLARRRNELLIKHCQTRMPVHRQKEELKVKQSTYFIIKHL